MRLRAPVVLLLALLAVVCPACSGTGPQVMPIQIIASEPAVDVFIDGEHAGVAPLIVFMTRGGSHKVVGRIGDREVSENVYSSMNDFGVICLVAGFVFIVPWLCLLDDGSYDLRPSPVLLVLPPAADMAPVPVTATP